MGRTIKELRQETTVYDSPSCKAVPLSWTVGAVDVIGEPGAPDSGFKQIENKLMSVSDLPTEFFNHQLMSCDCSNFDALQDFVTAWGFPYSPYRYIEGKDGFRALSRGNARKEAKNAFTFTDALIKSSYPAVVSLAEVKHAINSMQWVVTELRKAIAGEVFDDFTIVLNAATCSDFMVGIVKDSRVSRHMFGYCWEVERLTSAICNQIVDAMANDTPWRLCACKGCGVVFKSRADTDNARGNAKYCSKTCQKKQEKRNKSASARHRIDHGL